MLQQPYHNWNGSLQEKHEKISKHCALSVHAHASTSHTHMDTCGREARVEREEVKQGRVKREEEEEKGEKKGEGERLQNECVGGRLTAMR